jgi:hypothetical protein
MQQYKVNNSVPRKELESILGKAYFRLSSDQVDYLFVQWDMDTLYSPDITPSKLVTPDQGPAGTTGCFGNRGSILIS